MKRFSQEEKEQIQKMYQNGTSATQIAKHFGVSTPGVTWQLKWLGATMRTSSERMRSHKLSHTAEEILAMTGSRIKIVCNNAGAGIT